MHFTLDIDWASFYAAIQHVIDWVQQFIAAHTPQPLDYQCDDMYQMCDNIDYN